LTTKKGNVFGREMKGKDSRDGYMYRRDALLVPLCLQDTYINVAVLYLRTDVRSPSITSVRST